MTPIPTHTVVAVGLLALTVGGTATLLGGGVGAILRVTRNDLEDSIATTQRAVTALVAVRQDQIRREALMVASDAEVIDGVGRRDWAAVARGATAHLRSGATERFADFIGIYDQEEAPLMEVPPPGVRPADMIASAAGGLAMVNGAPLLVASVPVGGKADPSGTVVIGRRLDRLMETISADRGSLSLVFVAGDSVVVSTLSDAADIRWSEAEVTGRVTVGSAGYIVRPLVEAPAGRLLLLVSEQDAGSRWLVVWIWVAGALAMVAAAAGGWSLARARRPRLESDHRADALAALVAWTPAAADTPSVAPGLDLLMRLTRADAGVVYRVEPNAGLAVVVHRGFLRPLDQRPLPDDWSLTGSGLEPASMGTLPASSLFPDLGGGIEARLARPIAAGERIWGILALGARRRFSADDVMLAESVCRRLAVTAERDRLARDVLARDRRLRSLAGLGQEVVAALSPQHVFERIASAACGLLSGASACLWVLEGDMLVLRSDSDCDEDRVDYPRRLALGQGLAGNAAVIRTPLITEDVLEDPLTVDKDWMRDRDWESAIHLPLLVRGRLGGVLGVLTRERYRFSPDEIAMLSAFANQAAIALEHSRLDEELSGRAGRMRTLADTGRSLVATLEPRRILAIASAQCREALGGAHLDLYVADPDGGLRLLLTPPSEAGRVAALQPGEGVAGRAVSAEHPVWSPDISSDSTVELRPDTRARLAASGGRAELAVPFVLEQGAGALVVCRPTGSTFSASDIEFASILTAQVAVALDNARLFGLEQRRHAQILALADIERELAAELHIERLLTLIIERASTLLDATGVIWFVEGDGRMVPRAWHGMHEGLRDLRLTIGEGLVGACARDRRGLIVNDYAASPFALPGFERYTRSMVQPLAVRDRVLGVIALNRLAGSRPFTEAELATFETFALQAATALDNARRFAEERLRRAHLASLLEINKKIGSLMPTEALLSAIAEEARRLLNVDNAGFRLVEGDELVLAGVAGKARETMIRPRLRVGESLSGFVAARGEPLVLDDITTFAGVVPEHLAADQRIGYKTFLGVPLRVGERTIGVLTFRGFARFGSREVELAESFAGQAAIALENARLLQERQRYAERLQALDGVNRQISGSLQFEEVLENIATAVAGFVEAPYVSVWIADAAGQRLRRHVRVTDPALSAQMPADVAYDERAAGWVAKHRETIPWTDLSVDSRFGRHDTAVAHGLGFFSGYPIVLGDRVLGVISMLRPTPYLFTPEAEPAIRSLVAHAAVAVENARLYRETATQLRQTQALLEVAELLDSALEARTLLNQVAARCAQICAVDRCTIEVWQEGHEISVTSQFADGRKEPVMWQYLTETYPRGPWRMGAHVRVTESRTPVIIADARDSDLFPREMVDRFGIRAALVVPLVRQDRAVGVMLLDYTDRDGVFEKWQVELAMAIAGQLALGLDNSRLYAEAQQRLRETSTLLAVGQALSQPGPSGEVMRQVARAVGHAFGPDMVGVYLLDERKEALVPAAGWHVPKEILDHFMRTPFVLARFSGLIDAWRDGHAVAFADVTTDSRVDADSFRGLPPLSALFVPTKVRGESVGALFLCWQGGGRQFRPAELSLVEAVASQVGLSLENAELTRQTQLKLKETETLLEVARALTSTLDLPQLLRHFLRQVQRAVGSDSVGIWLTDGSPHELQAVLGYRVPEERLEALRQVRVSLDYEFYAEAFRSRRPVFSPDVASEPRIPAPLREGPVAHRSQLFVPIVAKNVPIGGFIAVWWEERRDMAATELALLETIAGQVAVAIENARLFRDNQRRLEDLAVLYDVSQTMTGQLDRDALVETLHRQIARVLDARTMVILRYDDLRGEFEVAFRVHRGVPQSSERGRRYPLEAGLVARVVERRQSIRTDDYVETCHREGVTPVDGGLPFPYWLGVPMIAGDEVVGVIALRTDAQPYREEDERLLMNIAGLAALAFRSAGLYEERARAYGELAAAQDQLVQAEKLRALGEMASGVAHDFNNLLTSIIGRAQILLRTITDPRLRQSLTAIEQAALDGAQTVRRIQEFTRQRRDQPFVGVDINSVVQAALEITQSRWRDEAQGRGIDIRLVTDLGAVPPIAGDPVDLRGALTNLILNAIDAMPAGGVLTVRTRAEAGRVTVTIADTGEGMTDEAKRRLFEPFFTTKGPKGTGLGLSMTFGIVSRHGGRIDVESAPGAGATFLLSFPGTTVETPEETARVAAPHRQSEPSAHCLVVDDEERVRETLGDLLSLAGHTTVLAGRGEEAIELFKAETFDLVFTDLAMPGLSGWQVARACKEMRADVPVLLVTGLGVELSRQQMAAHGVDAVLSKPLKIDEVLDAVAQYRRRP